MTHTAGKVAAKLKAKQIVVAAVRGYDLAGTWVLGR
jgi:hypothetical protein